MSTVRSPNYPQLDLAGALEVIREAYVQEHRNKMSRSVLATHLGYTSLNGRALAKIGAVRAYGLISGLQDDLRVTNDAITCLEAPEDDPERAAAMARCALKPPIFREIHVEFPSLPSEHNLRFFLVKRGYTSDAASKAAQTYLSTMRLVSELSASYPALDEEIEMQIDAPREAREEGPRTQIAPQIQKARATEPPPPGQRRAVFDLTEGEVVITFPDSMSPESVSDLQDYLNVFMKKAKREAGVN